MEKIKVVIDFETKSPIDLPKMGRVKYSQHPDADILMMSYATKTNPVRLWLPGDPLPDFAINPENYIIYAHNVEFEWAITNYIGVRRYGFKPTKLENYECLMALCGRYGLPQKLDTVAKVLNLKNQKNPEGYALIKRFCIPPYEAPTGAAWERFKQYCVDDTKVELELLRTLPGEQLSEKEKETWVDSCLVNLRGIPVDLQSVRQIRRVAEQYRQAHYELLPEMTENRITKITQVARLTKYLNDHGVEVDNLRKDTVQELLLRDDIPENCMMLLEMRADLGLSSIGKYVRFEEMCHNGRIYDNLRYYGAHTGRWTGCGVQLLNLPRASVDNPEATIDRYFDGSVVDDNPVQLARALIRPMIKAEEGKLIAAADYSSIEYVLIEWLAGNKEAIKRFAAGFDQYIDQAMFMYDKGYKDVSKTERQNGKVVVLGCGYGQGAIKLMITAKQQFGLELSFEEAEFLVKGYRKNHWQVVKMWYTLKDAMVTAIKCPGQTIESHLTKFKVVQDRNKTPWLAMTIPSGRVMYYNRPFIELDKFGEIPCHYGVSQKSKQWVPMKLIPGRITENIVQAIARDILVYGKKRCKAAGLETILDIYDEIVCEVNEQDAEQALKMLCVKMCEVEPWAKDIPLRAEGFVGKRYKKM